MKTTYTAAEAKELGLFGKKPPPPIKMPKDATQKPPTPAMQRQLDLGEVEKVLDRFHLLPPTGTFVEYHPTHRIYITEGITFILKPLEP